MTDQATIAILTKALVKIARPANAGCGCSFPCLCDCHEAEEINAGAMRDIADEALAATTNHAEQSAAHDAQIRRDALEDAYLAANAVLPYFNNRKRDPVLVRNDMLNAITSLKRAKQADLAAKEDDGWIEWRGGECPVDSKSRIEVRIGYGGGGFLPAAAIDWKLKFKYRVAKESPTDWSAS